MPVITLITDFGIEDEFVGVMKGVILTEIPSATIVDISHHIDPQNIVQAAFLTIGAYSYFPRSTVHIIVVDPGVGTRRRNILAVNTGEYTFVAPDNGVLSLLLDAADGVTIVRVENDRYFRQPVSNTFHGRDIFAPVGAHLAAGLPIQSLGPVMDRRHVTRLPIPRPSVSAAGVLTGTVISVDRFGNLITNIDSSALEALCKGASPEKILIRIGHRDIVGLSANYAGVPIAHPLTVVGSRGYLEIAIRDGNARENFNAEIDDPVRITLSS